MTTSPHNTLTLFLAGWLGIGLTGCARSSVAIAPDLAEVPGAPQAQLAQNDKAAPGDRFAFPADKGGQALGELLRPPQKLEGGTPAPAPRPLLAPVEVERPAPPLPDNGASLPRPSLAPKAPPLRPRVLPEEAPLASYRSDPPPVIRQELPPGALVRVPSHDVNAPPPLPILAQPGIDRVPLEDPTTEDSLKAALSAPMPVRTNPAPFMRRTLPDPFENSQTVRLRALPPEPQDPASGPLRPPRP